MRNLKKILSLLLTFTAVLSFVISASAAPNVKSTLVDTSGKENDTEYTNYIKTIFQNGTFTPIKASEATAYGKEPGDFLTKVNQGGNNYIRLRSASSDISLLEKNDTTVISFEINTNGATDCAIKLQTDGSCTFSSECSSAAWKNDEWHRITYVFYPIEEADSKYSIKTDLYVDGIFEETFTKTDIANTITFKEIRLLVKKNADYFLDNVKIMQIDKFELPDVSIKSGSELTVKNNIIYGYTGKTVAQVKTELGDAALYDGETLAASNAAVTKDMTVKGEVNCAGISFVREYSFAADDLPKITLVGYTATDITIDTSEDKSFEFVISDDNGIEKSSVVLNNVSVGENITSYTITSNDLKIGKNVIKISAEDTANQKTEKEFTVTRTNNPPVITLVGYKDTEISIGAQEKKTFEFRITDTGDIAKSTITVNGVQRESGKDVYTLSNSALALGKNVIEVFAEDSFGAQEKKKFTITQNLSISNTLWSEDFTNYNGGSTDNIGITNRVGEIRTENIDEEHGKSLSVGIETPTSGQTKQSYISLKNSSDTDNIVFEFQIYVKEKATDNGGYIITAADITGNTQVLMQFYQTVKFCNGQTKSFNKGEWIDVVVDTNVNTHKIDIYFGGTKAVSGYAMTSSFTKVARIDINSPLTKGTNTFMSVDNIKCIEKYDAPTLSFGDEKLDYKSDTVKLFANGELDESTLSEEMFSVANKNGDAVNVTDVRYSSEDRAVILKVDGKFQSNTQYFVNVDSGLKLKTGYTNTYPVTLNFMTTMGSIETENTVFKRNEENPKKIDLSVTITNTDTAEKSVFAAVSEYNGKKFVGIKIIKLTVAANQTLPVSEHFLLSDESNTAEMSFWGNDGEPYILKNTVYLVGQ